MAKSYPSQTAAGDPVAALSLRANFSWSFVSNVVYAGCQWGMLVVLAKLGTPEMVGQFALGLAVTAPVIMFTNLQLRAVQATDARRDYLFCDYLGLRLITTALALLVIAVLPFVSGYRRETALVILVVGLAKAFESLSDVFYGLFQQHERMDRIAKSKMLRGPLSLVALGAGVYLTGSVLWGAAGLALAWALILVGYDAHSGVLILRAVPHVLDSTLPCWRHPLPALRPRWAMGTLRKLVCLTLPLGVVTMLGSLNTNVPRYFIERYCGERELGIFAAMAYLMVAGHTVVGAMGQSASPRLAKYYAGGHDVAFRMLLSKLVGIGALLGGTGVLMTLLAGREILTLLYRPEYAEHANVFLWLVVVAGVHYIVSFLGNGMTAARYFRAQMPLLASVTSVSAIACLWLIPTHGLQGAAMAILIAKIVQTGGSLAIVGHALYRPIHDTSST